MPKSGCDAHEQLQNIVDLTHITCLWLRRIIPVSRNDLIWRRDFLLFWSIIILVLWQKKLPKMKDTIISFSVMYKWGSKVFWLFSYEALKKRNFHCVDTQVDRFSLRPLVGSLTVSSHVCARRIPTPRGLINYPLRHQWPLVWVLECWVSLISLCIITNLMSFGLV